MTVMIVSLSPNSSLTVRDDDISISSFLLSFSCLVYGCLVYGGENDVEKTNQTDILLVLYSMLTFLLFSLLMWMPSF